MSTLVVHPSRVEPTKLCFRNWLGCTASLVPERFREKLESTVHTLPVFSADVALSIALDAQSVAGQIGVTCRGASLKTDDVLVSSLSRESRDHVHKALHDVVLPYAMAAFPELGLRCATTPTDKNLFIVRYTGAGRPSLGVHKDQVPLTVNIALSPHCDYEGGGTYFPARAAECNGLVLRPHAGTALMHDGNVEHAGNKVTGGTRLILVCFFEGRNKDPSRSPACPLAKSVVSCGPGAAKCCCQKMLLTRQLPRLPKIVTLEELLRMAPLQKGRPGTVSLGMVTPAAFSGFPGVSSSTSLSSGVAPPSPGRGNGGGGMSGLLARVAASGLPAS
uniref:Fe2OG dioxygenase domain-containing protein n=1 Tax=Phaeocystis antarctica TaxID=33657 RepID=A0A7S0EM06_9EUKA|mmetsp:Transcript_26892/g.63604  ORF Transcript_26892/g.63604 Transcript_26892/m.63604 type:complete len:333 (+) Transcript_26892:73-1071(+)